MGKLDGKTALITGDERAYVFITGRREAELASAANAIGRNVKALQGDVSKLDDLDRIIAQIKQTKGELDIVFANAGVADSTTASLGRSMLAAFGLSELANRLFIDHVALAIGVRVAQTNGGLRPALRPMRGGLAPWQVRRAKELLSANLDGGIALKEIARECRLSVSHFSRAFRQTVGVAPHQWLLSFRVDSAKNLLREREKTLSEVALACGFSDQSHFTRVFTRITGVSPGAWRRGMEQDEGMPAAAA